MTYMRPIRRRLYLGWDRLLLIVGVLILAFMFIVLCVVTSIPPGWSVTKSEFPDSELEKQSKQIQHVLVEFRKGRIDQEEAIAIILCQLAHPHAKVQIYKKLLK